MLTGTSCPWGIFSLQQSVQGRVTKPKSPLLMSSSSSHTSGGVLTVPSRQRGTKRGKGLSDNEGGSAERFSSGGPMAYLGRDTYGGGGYQGNMPTASDRRPVGGQMEQSAGVLGIVTVLDRVAHSTVPPGKVSDYWMSVEQTDLPAGTILFPIVTTDDPSTSPEKRMRVTSVTGLCIPKNANEMWLVQHGYVVAGFLGSRSRGNKANLTKGALRAPVHNVTIGHGLWPKLDFAADGTPRVTLCGMRAPTIVDIATAVVTEANVPPATAQFLHGGSKSADGTGGAASRHASGANAAFARVLLLFMRMGVIQFTPALTGSGKTGQAMVTAWAEMARGNITAVRQQGAAMQADTDGVMTLMGLKKKSITKGLSEVHRAIWESVNISDDPYDTERINLENLAGSTWASKNVPRTDEARALLESQFDEVTKVAYNLYAGRAGIATGPNDAIID